MTEEEIRSIKGQTVEELSDARQQLACFKVKARNYKRLLNAVSPLLEGNPIMHGTVSGDNWPSYEDIRSVFAGIDRAQRQIKECESRLRDWGVLS